MTPIWQVISWIGAFGFATCAIPQAWTTVKKGSAEGMTWGFLLLWLLGEVCTFAYVLHDLPGPQVRPLVVNYIINGLCLLVLISYKLRPRTSNVRV